MACFPFCCVVGCVGYAACLVSGIVRFVCVVLVGVAGYKGGLFVGHTGGVWLLRFGFVFVCWY